MVRFEHEVAWVTGSGRGIGRAIAIAFAGAGARVVLSARSIDEVRRVSDEIRAAGGEAISVTCDVTQGPDVQAAFETAIDHFRRIDILVNNAGFVESAPLERLEPALWERTLDVNLTGTYRCTRTVLPAMIKQRHGRIINIASTAARVGYRYTTAYCAAKHGVLGFTRALALEVATNGVTVNAVCPGWVDTDMTKASIRRIAEKTGRSAEEARRTLEAMNPQRRLVRPEEVAAVALFLARRDAAAITGQAYGVDGGEVMA
jgi:3-hydroxybutyrate dehydrogenase